MATNKKNPYGKLHMNTTLKSNQANTNISNGIPIKSEHDFLIGALEKGADEILFPSRHFNNSLNMVEPTKGAAVYFGQAMEIIFLLNHAAHRCIELTILVNEDNPNNHKSPKEPKKSKMYRRSENQILRTSPKKPHTTPRKPR